jgi:hypothetical protein
MTEKRKSRTDRLTAVTCDSVNDRAKIADDFLQNLIQHDAPSWQMFTII